MQRIFELRGNEPNREMVQVDRMSPEEIESHGFGAIDTQPWGVSFDRASDKARLLRNSRGGEIWAGEVYQGCDVCACPEDEHPGTFSAHLDVSSGAAEVTGERQACDRFR